MRKTILAILALAAFAVNPAQAATQSYVAGSAGDAISVCKGDTIEDGVTSPENIGGACFTKSTSATVKIADAHGDFVPFWVSPRGANGHCLDNPAPGDPVNSDCPHFRFVGCASATVGKTFSLPAGTVRVEIVLDGPVFFALEPCNGVPATNGTITLT